MKIKDIRLINGFKFILFAILVLSLSTEVLAVDMDIPGYEGGINGDRYYKEVIFITGEPIKLHGSININERERRDHISKTYNYELESEDGLVTLDRDVVYEITLVKRGDELIENIELISFTETITTPENQYTTDKDNFRWSKSANYINKPGATYKKATWNSRKWYSINAGEGKVFVESSGETLGYDNFWSKTETQRLSSDITYTTMGEDGLNWEGSFEKAVSHSKSKDYRHENNTRVISPITGQHLIIEQEENVYTYSYDLPLIIEGEIFNSRNIGRGNYIVDTSPKNISLSSPRFGRDVMGHWAEEELLFAGALGAVNPHSQVIGPDLDMSRAEFAKLMSATLGLEVVKPEPVRTPKRTGPNYEAEVKGVFYDVSEDHNYFPYISAVHEAGVMIGHENLFRPEDPLTRAEATATFIRALGLQNKAPLGNYSLGFRDDSSVPIWARDYIYIGKDINLISGTPEGYFHPNSNLTKAESIIMMVNFIDYLIDDFRYDYRERVLNYSN